MGQFTDAGSIMTSWHRICTKDINVLGSWGFTGNDLPLGVDMLYRTREKYPWLDDHRINGQLIVPLALALDHCADAARRLGIGPAMAFSNIEILEPLTIENAGSSFAITARANSIYKVEMGSSELIAYD